MFSLNMGGKDFAKQFILKWLNDTGGSNLRLLEIATGLPINILKVLLNELLTEGNTVHRKGFGGTKVWRVK